MVSLRAILLIATLLVSCSSKNNEPSIWIEISKSIDGLSTTYIENKIEKGEIPPYVLINELTSYTSNQQTENDNKFRSHVGQSLFKCSAHLWSPVTINYYAEPMANGSITEKHERTLKESSVDLHVIEPKSNAEIIYIKACAQAVL